MVTSAGAVGRAATLSFETDESRHLFIEFLDRIAVREPPGHHHPDMVNYHPNQAGLQAFRTFPDNKLVLVILDKG